MVEPQKPESRSWTDTSRRFGYYFIGLAIGLMLLGFFQMKRQQQAAEMKARAEAARQQDAASAEVSKPVAPANSGAKPREGDTKAATTK